MYTLAGHHQNQNLSLLFGQPAFQFCSTCLKLFLTAQSSVNSHTSHENFQPRLPVGQVTKEICLPDRILSPRLLDTVFDCSSQYFFMENAISLMCKLNISPVQFSWPEFSLLSWSPHSLLEHESPEAASAHLVPWVPASAGHFLPLTSCSHSHLCKPFSFALSKTVAARFNINIDAWD